jgi:hypothetical protein
MYEATRTLTSIADCLCETIKNSQVPDVCFCGVVPGDGIVVDFAGGCRDGRQGMAWVRMTSLYPATGVNVVDETPNNCGAGIGMDFELGIVRPVAVMDARGNPPTPEQYLAAAALANDDALVMLKALRCCPTIADLDATVGTYTPAGPEGGVVGGTWPVAVLL